MIEESAHRRVCDALDRAIQERDALRRELAEAKEENQQLHGLLESARRVNENECFLRSREAGEAEQRLDAARAEAGRYRETLMEIVEFEPTHPHIRSPYEQIAAFAKNSARLALATPAADVAYAPDDEVREIGRRMMDIHRETLQKLADADTSGEVGP